ncbi:MAG: hypothetical protein AAB767_04615 [Patescibacteria group bacterium]
METLLLTRAPDESVATWIAVIKQSRRTYLNQDFTLEQFREIPGRLWPVKLKLFPFNPVNGPPLFQLQKKRLQRPTYEHALCFAAIMRGYPRSVLFFHEPIYLSHVKHWGGLVTAIVQNNDYRYVCLPPANFDWKKGLWLAGVERIP